jgi:hypothetical protein
MRRLRGRVQFTNNDRLFFIQLYRWFPSVLKAMTIMRPETVMRWQRAGFAATGVGNRGIWAVGRRSPQICGH